MESKIILIAVLFTMLFMGCTMIPEYERPEPPVPETWPARTAGAEEVSPAGNASDVEAGAEAELKPKPAKLPWRQFFVDERLQVVMEMALENNRDLRSAALNVERMQALYRIQRAELFPKVDAMADESKSRTPADLSGRGSAVRSKRYSVEVGITSWEIDFFGYLRSLKEGALEEYFATVQARNAAQILLLSEVAGVYLSLAADRESLEVARLTLAARQGSFDLIERRFEVGIASELQVHQARTLVEGARVDLALYEERIALDENALDLLVGAPVPAELLPSALSGISPLREISPGTSSDALLDRPDILQAESLLKEANANIGAARAALFPRITLTTSMGTASRQLSGLFKPNSRIWNFSPGITLPIFDPRTWSALDATKVERELAVTQYEAAIQSAFREVADALTRQETLKKQTEAQTSLVDSAREACRLASARFDAGTDIYLNVLDAQRSLYTAQQGMIGLRLAGLANQVRLYAVLGGGGDSR